MGYHPGGLLTLLHLLSREDPCSLHPSTPLPSPAGASNFSSWLDRLPGNKQQKPRLD